MLGKQQVSQATAMDSPTALVPLLGNCRLQSNPRELLVLFFISFPFHFISLNFQCPKTGNRDSTQCSRKRSRRSQSNTLRR